MSSRRRRSLGEGPYEAMVEAWKWMGMPVVDAAGVVPLTVVVVESHRRVPHPGFTRVRDDIGGEIVTLEAVRG